MISFTGKGDNSYGKGRWGKRKSQHLRWITLATVVVQWRLPL
ncbi:hypothetical protein TAF16_2123 [Anoxybacillus flavithermus]|uniref:Uncharacterized protein n=1 Tax=Anoxybacillus flavithermus TaxID=33934 RepID=A0A178T932_9BACL|nr:hypothetical protein TAF16_2123 [Anoxybacillus flavithermus]